MASSGENVMDRWPEGLPVAQVRLARPTDRLAAVVRYCRDGIGLTEIGSFAGHAGCDGVMLRLPGWAFHLEFTQHDEGIPCPAPTRDNLLVLPIPDAGAIAALVARLGRMGHSPAPSENPYWTEHGVTIEGPDGWRVVLMLQI